MVEFAEVMAEASGPPVQMGKRSECEPAARRAGTDVAVKREAGGAWPGRGGGGGTRHWAEKTDSEEDGQKGSDCSVTSQVPTLTLRSCGR